MRLTTIIPALLLLAACGSTPGDTTSGSSGSAEASSTGLDSTGPDSLGGSTDADEAAINARTQAETLAALRARLAALPDLGRFHREIRRVFVLQLEVRR